MWNKIKQWWWFTLKNPVVREGEHGGFKWKFRRFWLDISTLSGNFKARFMAGEHPYGYLISGKTDENIEGFVTALYSVGMLLTTDQKFVNDISRAIKNYEKRCEKKTVEEEGALVNIEEAKRDQAFAEMTKEEAKEVDKRFRKSVRKAKHEEKAAK